MRKRELLRIVKRWSQLLSGAGSASIEARILEALKQRDPAYTGWKVFFPSSSPVSAPDHPGSNPARGLQRSASRLLVSSARALAGISTETFNSGDQFTALVIAHWPPSQIHNKCFQYSSLSFSSSTLIDWQKEHGERRRRRWVWLYPEGCSTLIMYVKYY